jgi:virulence factor Mce-like protein
VETHPPTRRALLMLVAFALVCFLTTLFVWQRFGGSIPFAPKGYRFHVLFQQGTNLAPNNAVRISGVPVGKVVAVTPRGELTDATIQLDGRYEPLPSDARAILRTKTLLGETFVALTPGTPRAPKLRDGATLPTAQVAPTQQLDQVLSTFDPPTRQAFQRLVAELSAATAGRGGDLNAALADTQPATADLQRVLSVLDAQRGEVGTLVADAGATLRAVGARGAALRALVGAGDQVFAATAARNTALTATVRSLPPFLTSLRGALGDLDQTVREGGPTVHALRPVAPLVRPALVELSSLSPRLRSLFAALPSVIRDAGPGLAAADRVVTSVAGLAPVLDTAGTELVPVVEFLDLYRREILAGMTNLGTDLQGSQPQGGGAAPLHYFRVLFPLTNESQFGASQRLPSNRHNPYFAPGAQDLLGAGGLRAFDCANTANHATVPATAAGAPPPCLTQAPWNFRGATRSFPHVERGAP